MEPLYIILIIVASVIVIIGIWALIEPHILDYMGPDRASHTGYD